jgi:hypothetical protein
VPALLVSRTGSPQIETIAPEAYTNQTIYARLEVIDGQKTITNFIATNYGSGAILYPSAPNDPTPSDTTIPRLFANKTAFTNAFAQNGSNDVHCSGCGLCTFEFMNLPEEQWSWTSTRGDESSSGTGFGGIFLFEEYYETPIGELNFSPLLAVQNVNLNPHSRACATTSQVLTIGITSADNYWTHWVTFYFENFKLGSNTATANYYPSPAEATISISVS